MAAKSKAASKAKARAGYSKGELRYKQILEAAEHILMNHGYHNFTLRKIAKVAEVSMGNLQYYFPSKDDLTRALVDHIVADYTGALEAFLSIVDPHEQFDKIISHVIHDLNRERTTVLFPEFWSLSNHDEAVSDILESMYEPYRRIMQTVVLRLNPNLTSDESYRIAVFITSAIEGFTMFIGHDKPWEQETDSFIEMSIRSFKALILDVKA